MKLDNKTREQIAKAQNITSLIGKKLAKEANGKKEADSKVDLNNLAEKLANRRVKALEEG